MSYHKNIYTFIIKFIKKYYIIYLKHSIQKEGYLVMIIIKIALILFLAFNIFTYVKRITSPKITQKEEHLIKVETLSLKFVSIIEILASSIIILYLIFNELNTILFIRLLLFIACIKIVLACIVAFIVYKLSYKSVKNNFRG